MRTFETIFQRDLGSVRFILRWTNPPAGTVTKKGQPSKTSITLTVNAPSVYVLFGPLRFSAPGPFAAVVSPVIEALYIGTAPPA